MYNSGNMFGFTGHDILKAIAETTNADQRECEPDQPETHAQPRPNLITVLKNHVQPRPIGAGSAPQTVDLASSHARSR